MSGFRKMALRFLIMAPLCVLMIGFVALPVRAGDEEKPAANGTNSKIQLGGVAWVVYRYQLADQTLATAPQAFISKTGVSRKGVSSFDLDRVYLTTDYAFTDRFIWRTILEGSNIGGVGALFVKNAFLKVVDPFGAKGTALKFGIFSHAMTGVIDGVWGYRSISQNSLNRYLGVSSAYAGAGLEGKVANGMLAFDATIADDHGYGTGGTYSKDTGKSDSNRNKYKNFMGMINFTPLPQDALLKGLHLALFGQMASTVPPAPKEGFVAPPLDASNNCVAWFDVFPHFKNDKLTVGLEVAERIDKFTTQAKPKDATIPAPLNNNKTGRYIGGVAAYTPVPKYQIFVRGDFYDPNKDVESDQVTVIMGGISHQYVKGIRSIVDIEYDKFQDLLDPDVTVSARMELSL